jgi:hypothetical protein
VAEAVMLLAFSLPGGHVLALQPVLGVLPQEWFEAANEG